MTTRTPTVMTRQTTADHDDGGDNGDYGDDDDNYGAYDNDDDGGGFDGGGGGDGVGGGSCNVMSGSSPQKAPRSAESYEAAASSSAMITGRLDKVV